MIRNEIWLMTKIHPKSYQLECKKSLPMWHFLYQLGTNDLRTILSINSSFGKFHQPVKQPSHLTTQAASFCCLLPIVLPHHPSNGLDVLRAPQRGCLHSPSAEKRGENRRKRQYGWLIGVLAFKRFWSSQMVNPLPKKREINGTFFFLNKP